MNSKPLSDEVWMNKAIELAHKARTQNEVPVGAVVIYQDMVIGEGWNQPIKLHDPTAHAEILALRDAGRRMGNYRLTDSTLYITLEPCVMCVGAIIHARIKRVVYGADDPKSGAAGSVFDLPGSELMNHHPEILGGVLATECATILQTFFMQRR